MLSCSCARRLRDAARVAGARDLQHKRRQRARARQRGPASRRARRVASSTPSTRDGAGLDASRRPQPRRSPQVVASTRRLTGHSTPRRCRRGVNALLLAARAITTATASLTGLLPRSMHVHRTTDVPRPLGRLWNSWSPRARTPCPAGTTATAKTRAPAKGRTTRVPDRRRRFSNGRSPGVLLRGGAAAPPPPLLKLRRRPLLLRRGRRLLHGRHHPGRRGRRGGRRNLQMRRGAPRRRAADRVAGGCWKSRSPRSSRTSSSPCAARRRRWRSRRGSSTARSRRRLFESLPRRCRERRRRRASAGNERATEAIKACAVTRSAAPLAWQGRVGRPVRRTTARRPGARDPGGRPGLLLPRGHRTTSPLYRCPFLYRSPLKSLPPRRRCPQSRRRPPRPTKNRRRRRRDRDNE